MTRLAARFWVDAYRRRLEAMGIVVMVVAHGDDVAGAVLIKLNTLDGSARAYVRGFAADRDGPVWVHLADGPEAEVEAAIGRQRGFDPDLWVLEVEDRAGRHMLDAEGLG
ncbi:MAG: DUF1491 family protein [Rhodobacteraceae bacterium]|nr:DUF1491 family protein [Paracoccaceae bacterium]